MRPYYFEKLEVWSLARKLAVQIYQLSENFPKEEMYGLTSQIRRAVVSISTNIAEGSSRNTGRDQARFSEIAFGSLMEVLSLLTIAVDLHMLESENLNLIRDDIETLGNKLNGFRNAQLRR